MKIGFFLFFFFILYGKSNSVSIIYSLPSISDDNSGRIELVFVNENGDVHRFTNDRSLSWFTIGEFEYFLTDIDNSVELKLVHAFWGGALIDISDWDKVFLNLNGHSHFNLGRIKLRSNGLNNHFPSHGIIIRKVGDFKKWSFTRKTKS